MISSPAIVNMDANQRLQDHRCPFCLEDFHGRDVAVVKARCGHRSDLHCIATFFLDNPIGSRQCMICQQNPMPLVNEDTRESYPDKSFPERSFFCACAAGDLAKVEELLAEGVDVNVAVIENGTTALMLASTKGHKNVVECLIRKGAKLNATQTSDGATALFMAAQEGNIDCLQALIKAGADLNTHRTLDGGTPLCIAFWTRNTECRQALVAAGAEQDEIFHQWVFFFACLSGDLDQVKKSLAQGVNVNAAMDNAGFTALMFACKGGNPAVVKFLINAGAQINVSTPDGTTPLWFAAFWNNNACMKVLITKGVQINATDPDGYTALYAAAQQNSIDCVKTLIRFGADVNAALTTNGATPLMIAVQKFSNESVIALLRGGADVNTSTFKGTTALSIACEKHNDHVVEALKRARAGKRIKERKCVIQ